MAQRIGAKKKCRHPHHARGPSAGGSERESNPHHTHRCTHAHTHTCTHAHMHTRTHAHMHTCTHAHAQLQRLTQGVPHTATYHSGLGPGLAIAPHGTRQGRGRRQGAGTRGRAGGPRAPCHGAGRTRSYPSPGPSLGGGWGRRRGRGHLGGSGLGPGSRCGGQHGLGRCGVLAVGAHRGGGAGGGGLQGGRLLEPVELGKVHSGGLGLVCGVTCGVVGWWSG